MPLTTLAACLLAAGFVLGIVSAASTRGQPCLLRLVSLGASAAAGRRPVPLPQLGESDHIDRRPD